MMGLVACGPGGEAPESGTLRVTASAMTSADVHGVLYALTCDDGTSLSEYVPLEVKALLQSTIPGNEPTLDWIQVVYQP